MEDLAMRGHGRRRYLAFPSGSEKWEEMKDDTKASLE